MEYAGKMISLHNLLLQVQLHKKTTGEKPASIQLDEDQYQQLAAKLMRDKPPSAKDPLRFQGIPVKLKS